MKTSIQKLKKQKQNTNIKKSTFVAQEQCSPKGCLTSQLKLSIAQPALCP